MTFKVGDRVVHVDDGDKGTVTGVDEYIYEVNFDNDGMCWVNDFEIDLLPGEENAVNPNHYQFPNGAEVRFISEWLTANAAQALQYIARSSRIDGVNKGDVKEDIQKAIRFLEFELERISR